jgi:RHS repeat-associated protein
MTYDLAGNLTYDNYTGGGTRTYDAEGRMTTAQFLSGTTQTATYTYDADGRRVKRDAGAAAEVWQVYGMGGELLAEYGAGAAPAQPQKEYGYRGGELLVTLEGGQRVNVALSSNGATAAASSTLDANRHPSAAINGDRRGLHYGSDPSSGSAWADTTQNAFPDWLEVTFGGSRTIDEISVFGVQDNYAAPAEPTEVMTGATYALSAFDVQYWTGSAWVTVAGGSVTNNTKVWRRFTFPAVTTTKVRVLAHGGGFGHSRVVELEVWGSGADARWLVADHIGTPRMVVDAGGQLSGVSRHDYFPFGEEISVGVGGRTTQQGHSQSDRVRQKFTAYERDGETGLDFAQARYHSPAQGRFASVDPLLTSGVPANPKTWNRYAYALNNPLKFVDPTGLIACPPGVTCINQGTADEHYYDPSIGEGEDGMVYSGTSDILPPGFQVERTSTPWGPREVAPSPAPSTPASWGDWVGSYSPYGVLMSAGDAVNGSLGLPTSADCTCPKESKERIVFRNGSDTDDNFTPRPGKDDNGLSAFTTLEAATPPGGRAQALDVGKLVNLEADFDDTPPGHVAIRPRDPAAMPGWQASRGTGTVHPLTQELKGAIVKRNVRRPKE